MWDAGDQPPPDGLIGQPGIGYLRRKLGEPRLIQTVRGIGYVLREET